MSKTLSLLEQLYRIEHPDDCVEGGLAGVLRCIRNGGEQLFLCDLCESLSADALDAFYNLTLETLKDSANLVTRTNEVKNILAGDHSCAVKLGVRLSDTDV